MEQDRRAPTPSQVRGEIQAGKTGDIREGFDPAAAPMETDGEAAGTPMTPEDAAIAIETQRSPRHEGQENYDTAMRKPASLETKPQGGVRPSFTLGLIAACVIIGALIVTLVVVIE